ncbi:MAG TPA: PAS domain S-box protein, partial [Bacteroidia bacterium]|nr:PAS domain S-box protein [Bacteroidia bacterium]
MKSHHNLRTLASYVVDITSDSIIITDTNQLILYVNPAFSQITGYTSSEIVGKTPSVLKSGKHPKRFYKKMWDTLLNGNIYRNVMINKHKSGTIIYEEKVIIPVRNKVGKITHYVSTGRDITDRMMLLQRLQQKKILLEQSKKDLETFVYKASHNLRGPVASIIGIASMFQEEVLDEKALQYCRFVQSCAQNLDEVLKSMLHLQLICKKENRNDRINFVNQIEKIRSSYSKYEGFNETDFVVSCNLKEKFISNEKMIDSLFQNIMHNAVKFRKLNGCTRNKVVIDISNFRKRLKIEFKDNGIGIKKQHISKVFDMYYKANNTHKGSGLGLYFAR